MSFLNAIKEALSTKTVKVEEKETAKTRTQKFVGEFKEVAQTHPAELLDAAQKLHGIEVIKDKATEKAAQIAEARKAKERLVFAVDSVIEQIGVVAEEILCLEDAILADQEAIKVAEDASKDVLDAMSKMDPATVLAAARAERAKKANKKQEPVVKQTTTTKGNGQPAPKVNVV
jgi:hypothetical protein